MYDGLKAASSNGAGEILVVNEHYFKRPQFLELEAGHRLDAKPSACNWSLVFKVQRYRVITAKLRVV
jgi:hypothetical protein